VQAKRHFAVRGGPDVRKNEGARKRGEEHKMGGKSESLKRGTRQWRAGAEKFKEEREEKWLGDDRSGRGKPTNKRR